MPMTRKYIDNLLKFGELNENDIFYDLGSGDGRVLIEASRDFKVKQGVGFEIAPWPYFKSRFLINRLKFSDISIYRKNSLTADVSKATFVYMYLFPKLVDRLTAKLTHELRPGAKILCPSFPIDTTRHTKFELKKEAKIGNITAYLYEKS